MDQIHVVRHKVLVEGASIRKVAKEMGIARNTVRRYLADTPPVGRQPTERKHPVSDAVRPRVCTRCWVRRPVGQGGSSG